MTARGRKNAITVDGVVHPDFCSVADVFRSQMRGFPGGGAICIYHRGACVVDLWGGFRDRSGVCWTRDTMAPSFSTTKGIASTLVHIMVDRGLLDYDKRVADYWPEFAQAGKQAITVRHVLAHQSGLYHIRQMIDHADRMLDWSFMIRAIERTPPAHEPGMRTGYHGLTYGYLVGELLQRVTGRSFSQLVQEDLVGVLGLDGMYIGAPPEALSRTAKLIWPRPGLLTNPEALMPDGDVPRAAKWSASIVQSLLLAVGVQFDLQSIIDALAPRGISSFDFGADRTLRASIPAANGVFTARSLARMYAALANGGEIDGVRLLSRKTLARATQVQTPTRQRVVIPWDMRWRLGYHAVVTTRGVPSHAFGHFGFGGSGGWADPRRQLAVALIVNGGMGMPFGDMRISRLSGAALACANRRTAPPHAGAAPWRRTPRPSLLANVLDTLAIY
jgi:CubicO group peptidase (beta-lactamase class C family)